MKIVIEYDSSWRNSFLDGSNNEPLPKKGRKFVGSMTSLRNSENFRKHELTLDTVMGLLNRLIGDQRKLYQARNDKNNYFFKDLESSIIFDDVEQDKILTEEMTYIRNISGSTDQQSFTGIVKSDDIMFLSDYSKELWAVLGLNFDELCDFILNKKRLSTSVDLNPVSLANRIDILDKSKKVENIGFVEKVVNKLNEENPDLITDKFPTPYIENDGKVKPIRFYAAALYMQLERLKSYFDMETATSNRGSISGFSKRGYNGRRDFMNRYTTGKPKKIWGNPYIRKERIKGIGEVTSLMTKASGTLEIEIPMEREDGRELEAMIKSAGVSSFYLGKKGLAYVSKIRV